MKSLMESSLKRVCLENHVHNHKGFTFCPKDSSKRSEICFLGLSSFNFKIVHFSLLSLQRKKTILPICCSDSVPALQSPSETQTCLQSEETQIIDTNQLITVHVKFQLQKECSFGQHFLIVGDDPVLGSWNPLNAVPLEWCEGHVWTVELDIPSGKTISYKFIMKGVAETILWQQGPDRIVQTWETNNTITVSEDWDDALLQKIVEEPFGEQFDNSAVDTDGDVNTRKTIWTSERLAIVAENITETKADYTKEANIFGNGMTVSDQVLSSKVLVSDEGVPLLVPGLTQVLTSETEVLLDENYMDIAEDSLGSKTVEFNVTEDESHGESTSTKETPMVMLNVKQEVREKEVIDESELVEGGDWSNVIEGVFGSDMQWGRRTVQKFFSKLGLFKNHTVELDS